jgi:hypothetical protein
MDIMKTRRLLIAAASVAVYSSVGCQPQHPPQKEFFPPAAMPSADQQPLDSAQPAAPGRRVDQMEASATSADLLAQQAESYAREMDALVSQRTARPPAKPLGAPAAAASPAAVAASSGTSSKVEWLDPADFRLGAIPTLAPSAATTNQPTVRQVIDTKPTVANSSASAAPEAPEQPKPSIVAETVVEAVPARNIGGESAGDPLLSKFSRRVKDDPRDVASHLEYQLLQFLKDEPTPELAALSTLPPEDRELVTTVLDGLTNFRNALRADSNMLLSRKIKPLMDMSERLRSQADLTIPTIVLCRSVDRFGIYDPVEPARFPVGKEQKVIVYCELANFASILNDKQLWETRLTWDMTLYAEQGMSVWSDKTDHVTDNSRSRLHDFFVCKAISLPQTLPIGRYLLKVTIVDTQSNRVAEATVPLLVAVQ